MSQTQRVKRNIGGTIELELGHAKTSELLDDDREDNPHEELTEAEIKQREREKLRKVSINLKFRRKKIKKFACLIITALVIAVYFGITSYYLNLVHQYERMYSDNYELIGERIQCYTNVAAYSIDTLARNDNITFDEYTNAAEHFI